MKVGRIERLTHTPGPWKIEPDLSNIGVGGVEMSNGSRVMRGDDVEPEHLRIEDARLIAAAPELLAALKEVCLAAVTVDDGCAICGADLTRGRCRTTPAAP